MAMDDFFDIQDERGARPTLVICPACNQPGFHAAWPWIISTRDTEATQRLLEGKLFKYQCPVCGESTTFAYDCLYHDVNHRALILYSSGIFSEEQLLDSLEKNADHAQWSSGTQTPAYQCRIVFNPFELYEKARIIECGYDDRVIELMKVAIKRGMLKEGIIGVHDTLVYERTLDDDSISFVVFGEIPGDVVGNPRGYEFLEKLLKDSEESLEKVYRFDSSWAERFLP